MKRTGDLTVDKHDKLLNRIESLIQKNQDDLLPGDTHLLNEDFDKLGEANMLDQRTWVAKMEAPVSAMNHAKTKNTEQSPMQQKIPRQDEIMNASELIDLTSERGRKGSGIWRRKCWG